MAPPQYGDVVRAGLLDQEPGLISLEQLLGLACGYFSVRA